MTARSSRFWNRFAQSYSRKPVPDPVAYQRKLEKTREYFRPDSAVLELGCGTGSTALAHAPYVAEILAIDYSSKMIEIAQQKAKDEGVNNATFQVAAADELNAKDHKEKYDVVMALSLLHLLDDPKHHAAQVFCALKPSGVFIQNTPVLGEKKRFLKPLFKIAAALRVLPRINVLTIDELTKDLNDAGFEVEHQEFYQSADAVFLVAKKPS